MDKLVEKLFAELKRRRVSVPDLEHITGIPRDRIYKWKQQGSRPKTEDEATIKAWLNDEEVVDKDKIRSLDAAVAVLLGEVAALRAERSGDSVQNVLLRLQKAVEDVAKML